MEIHELSHYFSMQVLFQTIAVCQHSTTSIKSFDFPRPKSNLFINNDRSIRQWWPNSRITYSNVYNIYRNLPEQPHFAGQKMDYGHKQVLYIVHELMNIRQITRHDRGFFENSRYYSHCGFITCICCLTKRKIVKACSYINLDDIISSRLRK